jgi:hypothetical protein
MPDRSHPGASWLHGKRPLTEEEIMDVVRWKPMGADRPAAGTGAVLAAVLAMGLSGCVAPFAEMQSARLVGRGNVEITPGYSYVKVGAESESQKAQDDFSLQVATGVSDRVDLRARYEMIRLSGEGWDNRTSNVLSLGPKIGLAPDRVALYAPVGLGFGGGLTASDTWMFHPTLLFTIPVSPGFEINPSAKAQIWLNNPDAHNLLAFNLGFGIGSDVREWAVRPEVGLLVDPRDHGHAWHFSVGVSRLIEGRD